MLWRGFVATLIVLTVSLAALFCPVAGEPQETKLGLVTSLNAQAGLFQITDVATRPGSDLVLMGQGILGVIAWDLGTGTTRLVPTLFSSPIVEVEALPDTLLALDASGHLTSINLTQKKATLISNTFAGTVRVTAVSEDEGSMAILGTDTGSRMGIKLLDTHTFTTSAFAIYDLPYDLAIQIPTSAAWLPDDEYLGYKSPTLMVGTSKGQVWAVERTGNATLVVDLGSTIEGLEWSWSNMLLTAATRDGEIVGIEVTSRRAVTFLYTELIGNVDLVCFDQTADRVAVGGSNGHVEIWDMALRKRTQILRDLNYSMAGVSWQDGEHLVGASANGTVAYWGPDTDGDSWADAIDAFPNDPTEWKDSDGDGVGDARDMFPLNPKEWWDTDNDGVGDRGDAFPDDPSEWKDSDGDGVGDNEDFIPTVNNLLAAGLVVVGVGVVASLPVVGNAVAKRRRERHDREQAVAWIEQLGLEPVPDTHSSGGRTVLDRAVSALRVRTSAYPQLLAETISARDTMVLNTMVALRVQEEIAQRGGVAADAAMARTVQLRDQLQELDEERVRLDGLTKAFWEVQEEVDQAAHDTWPDLADLAGMEEGWIRRIQVLENSLVHFRRSSIIKVGAAATKDVRGAFVVAAKELRVKGSDRPVGVKVGVPPRPEIEVPAVDGVEDTTPLSVQPPVGKLRTRQAMLVRDDSADLVVSVDNTLAEDLEELAVDLTISGDRLRHRGPHRVELGTLATGRSAAATFQMRIAPAPDPGEEPGELTRVLARVTAKAGSRRVVQALPAKATTLVSSSLDRPTDMSWQLSGGTFGTRGVRFPSVPSRVVLEALDFPHGMLPSMEGDLPGGGDWRAFASRTEREEMVMVAIGVMPGPEWVDLVVEVRGPDGFPTRDLAEELVDSVRFVVLSDRRLRNRAEDVPLPREQRERLIDLVRGAYIGGPGEGFSVANGDEGETS